MAWYGGLDDWVSLDKVPGVQNVSPPPSTHPLWNSPTGAPPAPVASITPPAEKKSSGIFKGCLIAAGVVAGLVIVGVGSCAILFGTAAKQIAEKEEAETTRAEASPISNLKWEGIDKIIYRRTITLNCR